MEKTEAKVSEKKKKEVEDIKRLIKEYKVLGVVNLEKLPAFNLMKIKSQLKDRLVLKYSKKRLIKIAFDQVGDKSIESLKEKLVGIPALIFTNEDPFKLFQILKKSKSPALAKTGDIAPRDIVVQAGPTEFTPGPMIGELGQMGIKTSVEGGKVVIKMDKLLVKEGEAINAKSAELMSKLKIEPMEIGLNLVLTYGNNEILVRSVLDIDVDVYFDNVKLAAGEGVNLALYMGYVTDETVELLIKKAVLEAEGLNNKVDLGNNLEEEKKEEIVLIPKPEENLVEEKNEEILPSQEETPVEEKIKEYIEQEKIQENIVEEMKTPLEKEIDGVTKYEEEREEDQNDVVIEQRKPNEITKEDMKKAEEHLKELINKKIRGEI